MLISLSILLGVVFWVWVIDEVVNDDDDDKSSDTEETPIDEEGNDLLLGEEGDETLEGEEGDDVLYGDRGNDVLNGGDGGDLLLGGAGDDELVGGSGEDVLVGGEGADTMTGSSGGDLLDGTSLLDEAALVNSLQTADTADDLDIQYGDGPDTDEGDSIQGLGGDDVILMGSEDSVSGGAGNDLFSAGTWIRPGEPAIIEDYDAAQDVIAYSYEDSGTEPTITTSVDAATGDATVFADGEEVIVVLNAGPSFDENNILLVASAA